MKLPRYSRSLAIHEAGHAVATVRLGLQVKGVHMRTRAEVMAGDWLISERGRVLKAEGMVEGAPHVNPDWTAELIKSGQPVPPIHRPFAIVDIATSAAGPYAEARFSRRALLEVEMCGGGVEDTAHAERIAALLPDPSAALLEGRAKARALVRARWAEIELVADLIQHRRFTDGEEIHRLLD